MGLREVIVSVEQGWRIGVLFLDSAHLDYRKFNPWIVFVYKLVSHNLHAVAVVLDGPTPLKAVQQSLERVIQVGLIALKIDIGIQLEEPLYVLIAVSTALKVKLLLKFFHGRSFRQAAMTGQGDDLVTV